MRAGGLLAVLVAAIASALFAIPASADDPQGMAAQMSLMEGDQRSVFTAGLAEQPPLESNTARGSYRLITPKRKQR
jgi:hypothetical protein